MSSVRRSYVCLYLAPRLGQSGLIPHIGRSHPSHKKNPGSKKKEQKNSGVPPLCAIRTFGGIKGVRGIRRLFLAKLTTGAQTRVNAREDEPLN